METTQGQETSRVGNQVFLQIFEVNGYPSGAAIIPANSFVELPDGRFFGPVGKEEGKRTMARFFNWMEMNDQSPTGLKWSNLGQAFIDQWTSVKG